MTGDLRRLGLFVGVVVLVVGVAAVAGMVAADRPTAPATDATVDNDYYTSPDLLADSELEPGSGEVAIDGNPSRTVLIASDGDPSDVEPVVNALVADGHEVRFLGGGSGGPTRMVAPGVVAGGGSDEPMELEPALDEADALLIVGDPGFEEADHDTIEEFVDAGGRLVVATDATSGSAFGSGPDETALTSRFGVTVGEGYLYDMHDNDANFRRIYADGSGPVSDDADRLVFYRASPVWSDGGQTLATADTRYSTTRESGTYAVAVRNGNALVVGDADLLRPLNYNRADNEVLLGETLSFLTGGPADPYSPPDEERDRPPRPPEEAPERPPDE